jgi:hypothetical protein
MDDKVNLEAMLERLDKTFLPGIVGYLNDYKLILVKVLGDFVCPKADRETHVLLIEPRATVNTGDAGGDMTAEPLEI